MEGKQIRKVITRTEKTKVSSAQRSRILAAQMALPIIDPPNSDYSHFADELGLASSIIFLHVILSNCK